MSTPLSQFPKPEAEQYKGKRKLFLVPNFVFSPDAPEEGRRHLDRYWSEVRDHVHNLERSLGSVTHVFHETVFVPGDEGMKMLEAMNPQGCSFIQALCNSTARLEATEDQALVEEGADWQRCISIGLMSEKVLKTALDGYQDVTQRRYEHIGAKIDETLKEGESGVLFMREDHRIQWAPGIQVFFVAPPALDALKRWLNDRLRSVSQPEPPPEEKTEPEPPTAEQPDDEQTEQEPEKPDAAPDSKP